MEPSNRQDHPLFSLVSQELALLKEEQAQQFAHLLPEKLQNLSEKFKEAKILKGTEYSHLYQEWKRLVQLARESLLPFRATEKMKQSWKTGSVLPDDFDLQLPQELKQASKKEKKEWLHTLEAQSLKLCRPEALRIGSSIFWLHGTNSSILPMLPYTQFTLLPTGQLLSRGLAPMCGEISQGGLGREGINQRHISVDTIKGVGRCLQYARTISHTLDPWLSSDAEGSFLDHLQQLESTRPENGDWLPHIVHLFRVKQWSPQFFAQLCDRYQNRIQALQRRIQEAHSPLEMGVLFALEYDENRLKEALQDPREGVKLEQELVRFFSSSWQGLEWIQDNTMSLENILVLDHQRYTTRVFETSCRAAYLAAQIFYLKIHGEELRENLKKRLEEEGDQDLSPLFKKMEKYGGDAATVEEIVKRAITPIMRARMLKNEEPSKQRLLELKRLFTAPPSVQFTEEDKLLMTNPFPMVLASTRTKSSHCISQKENNLQQAVLGKDIDLIFVPREKISAMQEWLSLHGMGSQVQVYPDSYLDELTKIPLYHSPDQVHSRLGLMNSEALQKVHALVQRAVVPIYRSDYPDGSHRKYHGVPHAMRTLLFSHVISSMRNEAGQAIRAKPEHLLISAAAHDIAREGDGKDIWDRQSGEKCKDILQKEGVESHEALLLERAIAEKDHPHPETVEQKIVHDADCIEIMRCLFKPADFRSQELWIMRELDQGMVQLFIAEARQLIEVTETEKVKEWIESSEDPLQALYQILFLINDHYGQLPFLGEHLYHSRSLFNRPGCYLLDGKVTEAIQHYFSQIFPNGKKLPRDPAFPEERDFP